jgi:type IV secretion system protein VirD4
MRDLVVSGEPADRVLLGRLAADTTEARMLGWLGMNGGTPALAAPSCSGVLVVGASRIGKTTSMLVPAVRRWEGPVIATSIRSDLLANSWETREQAGWPILVYNPKNQGGFGSSTWSPLVAAMGERPWAGARRMAKALVTAAGLADGGANTKKDFWNATAADYLGPLLLAAATDGPSMEPVMRWLQEGGVNDENGVEGGRMKDEVRARLANHPDALRAAESVWGLYFKLRDSIYLTARTALTAYEDEQVLETCRPTSGKMPDITPDAVLGSSGASGEPARPGATLYIISPPTESEYFAPLFSALVTSLIEAAYDRAGEVGKLNPPLLLALDEVANITPIKELPRYSSTAAGEGIQLLTVLQDLGQAEQLWGETGTRTLLTNHYGGRLIFGGTVDPPTLRWVQEMLGVIDRERITRNEEGLFGNRSRSRSWERQPVATAAEIRTMPRGTALLISGSAPPARVTLRQWTTI